jgi:hypothetical protein
MGGIGCIPLWKSAFQTSAIRRAGNPPTAIRMLRMLPNLQVLDSTTKKQHYHQIFLKHGRIFFTAEKPRILNPDLEKQNCRCLGKQTLF